MHRPYREDTDGWRNEMPDAADYPGVQMAIDTLEMFRELQAERRENWRLRKENEMFKRVTWPWSNSYKDEEKKKSLASGSGDQ